MVQVVTAQVCGMLKPPSALTGTLGQLLKLPAHFRIVHTVRFQHCPNFDGTRRCVTALNAAHPGLMRCDHFGCLWLVQLGSLPVPLERCAESPAAHGWPSPCGHRPSPLSHPSVIPGPT